MRLGGHAAKFGPAETKRIKAQHFPKMELGLGRHVKARSRRTNLPYFETLASVIKAFGEFAVLVDPDGKVAAFWASRRRRRSSASLIGLPISSVLHPSVLSEIQALARQSDALHRRQELEYSVRLRGRQRWFSVCAFPLEKHRALRASLWLVARDVTHRVEATHALAERGALLAQAEEIANFGSWELNLKTNQLKLSPQLMKIYDLTSAKSWSAKTYWNRMHPADRARVRRIVDKGLADHRPIRYVARYCAPDGRTRVHLAHSLPLLGVDGKPERAMGVIQDVTEQVQSNQELRRISQQLLKEQDNQRRQLARELHESAGQSLAALKMTLGRLREAVSQGARAAASLTESATALADAAAREVRTVSYLLHPPMLDDAGLGPALRWYARGFTERSGISVSVEIADPFPRYSQEIETTIFRVVQEALTNVHRYSGSRLAEIRVTECDSQLRVEVRDHGCGFASSANAAHGRAVLGVGISGMRERVEQIGGTFELDSVPAEGTTVRVTLPSGAAITSGKSSDSPQPMLTRRPHAPQITARG